MLLKNRKTDLKSLKYGKDRPGGGSSNQPYIKSKIPTGESGSNFLSGPDFLLRGGSLIGKRIVDDVSRISSIMFDTRSPQGLLFTAKQLALQRQSPSMGGKPQSLFESAYLPITPSLQAAGTPIGLRLNGKGNPLSGLFGDIDKNNTFLSKIDKFLKPTNYSSIINRESDDLPLINYSKEHMFSPKLEKDPGILYKYQGGPDAILGFGETIIKLGERTGLSNKKTKSYLDKTYKGIKRLERTEANETSPLPKLRPNWIKPLPNNPMENGESGGRINLISPTIKTERKGVDNITLKKIYSTTGVIDKEHSEAGTDLVKFRIAVIDNDLKEGEVSQNNIHFRAYIDSFSDSYNAEWQDYKFSGRGEKFHRYNSFTRDINMSWTVAALSHKELIPMYKKLNYLASSLAPSYSKEGYMRGNLIKLTVGGYLYEQVGILHSLTYTIPDESPWEINIKNDYVGEGEQNKLRELPHMIKVTGVKFTPIHNFRPEVATLVNNKSKFISLKNKNGDLHDK